MIDCHAAGLWINTAHPNQIRFRPDKKNSVKIGYFFLTARDIFALPASFQVHVANKAN
jgi:hypothetical protein